MCDWRKRRESHTSTVPAGPEQVHTIIAAVCVKWTHPLTGLALARWNSPGAGETCSQLRDLPGQVNDPDSQVW